MHQIMEMLYRRAFGTNGVHLYRKYVVYFGCQAHAPRASVLRERQRMRIHDNILRTRCMNVIVYGCARFYD